MTGIYVFFWGKNHRDLYWHTFIHIAIDICYNRELYKLANLLRPPEGLRCLFDEEARWSGLGHPLLWKWKWMNAGVLIREETCACASPSDNVALHRRASCNLIASRAYQRSPTPACRLIAHQWINLLELNRGTQ